jgi:hydroxymethylpyrimidine pyrophosphatase-like HAD family hydrolase
METALPSPIELLIADVDGTLVTSDKRLTARTIAAADGAMTARVTP